MAAQPDTYLPMKQGCRKMLAIAGLLLLTGCLAYPHVEPIAVTPIDGGLDTLALMRPTWDGTRPDMFCVSDIGDDIHWQLKRSLLKRGYQVIEFKVPSLEISNRPDPVAGWSGKELRQSAPESADGIFRLRIVEYLDASLCDGRNELKFLGITAIAEIFDRKNGQLIWQTRQLCSDLSGRTDDAVFNCTGDLAQKIATRLPLAAR